MNLDKTKAHVLTRKNVSANLNLQIYTHDLKRLKQFTFLGIWLYGKLTWKVHIPKIIYKCKRVLNVMRCLVGREYFNKVSI